LEKQLVDFWSFSTPDAIKILSSSERGLSGAESGDRIKTYGPNTLTINRQSSSLILFLSQFKSPITILLIAAVFLSTGLGQYTDASIILVIVLISSFLGFWQEKGAARAVSELLDIMCREIVY
jgi:P-type Mg2+ transporter